MRTAILAIAAASSSLALCLCACSAPSENAVAATETMMPLPAAPAPSATPSIIEGLLNAKAREFELQSSLEASDEELSAKSAELESLRSGNPGMEEAGALSKAGEEIRGLVRENGTLKDRIKSLEEELSNLSEARDAAGRIRELKLRIDSLKLDRISPEKYWAAIDEAEWLRGEAIGLHTENAALKEALAEAKAGGDAARRQLEALTARFDLLSRKYEALNGQFGGKRQVAP